MKGETAGNEGCFCALCCNSQACREVSFHSGRYFLSHLVATTRVPRGACGRGRKSGVQRYFRCSALSALTRRPRCSTPRSITGSLYHYENYNIHGIMQWYRSDASRASPGPARMDLQLEKQEVAHCFVKLTRKTVLFFPPRQSLSRFLCGLFLLWGTLWNGETCFLVNKQSG